MRTIYLVIVILIYFPINILADDFWNEPMGPFGGDVKVIRKDSQGNLFAIAQENLFKSIDRGNTWKRIDIDQFTEPRMFCLEIDKNDLIFIGTSKNLYYSKNSGESWFHFDRNLLNRTILYICLTSMGDYIFGTDRGIYRFRFTNEPVYEEKMQENVNILSLAVNENDSIIYAGTSNLGILIGFAWGKLWERKVISDNNTVDINTIIHIKNHELIAGLAGNLRGGIYYSYDDGLNWTLNGLAGLDVYSASLAASIGLFACTEEGVFKFNFSNETWLKYGNNDFKMKTYSILHYDINNDFIATTEGIYHKDNEGSSWKQKNFGLNTISLNKLFLYKDRYIFANSYRLNLSENRWDKIDIDNGMPSYINSLVVNDIDQVFAAKIGGVYRSTDFGDTWETISIQFSRKSANSITKGKQGKLYICSSDNSLSRIFLSTDDGFSWSTIGEFKNGTGIQALAQDSSENLFVCIRDAGIYKLEKNTEDWKICLTDTRLFCWDFECGSNNSLYLINNNKILVSYNNGEN